MPITYAQKSSTDQKNADSNAAFVVDSSSQSASLQRKADMANCANQRVVQRDTGVVQRLGEADGKFMYVANLENNKYVDGYDQIASDGQIVRVGGNPYFRSKLPFDPGMIIFTKYHGGEIKSPGFTGCLMMAFHFNGTILQVNSLIGSGSDPLDPLGVGAADKYIAHIYCDNGEMDTKNALFDAERRNLITIEALFKPQIPVDDDNVKNECLKCNFPVGYNSLAFTGGLEIDRYGRWGAKVYAQNANVYSAIKKSYQQTDDCDMKLKHFNSEELDFQTLSTKALLYVAVLNKKIKSIGFLFEENVQMNQNDLLEFLCMIDYGCSHKLYGIAIKDVRALKWAKSITNDMVVKKIFDVCMMDFKENDNLNYIPSELSTLAQLALFWASVFKPSIDLFARKVYNPLKKKGKNVDWNALLIFYPFVMNKIMPIVSENKKALDYAVRLTNDEREQMILKGIKKLV